MNYHEDYNRLVHIGTGTKVETENAIERGKLSVVSFISLCMQAAIQGGVLPDVAYSRGDMYTQEVLRAKTYGDLVDVSHTMYEDLLLCVHELHVNKQVSPTIQACCNYIREYVDTDLSIRSLADRLGYSEYYLSRKFSKEMGVSISYYIRAAKVERAKVLLRCTSDSIEKISDDLFFCTRNYFTYCFNSIVNMSPNEYRKSIRGNKTLRNSPFHFYKKHPILRAVCAGSGAFRWGKMYCFMGMLYKIFPFPAVIPDNRISSHRMCFRGRCYVNRKPYILGMRCIK